MVEAVKGARPEPDREQALDARRSFIVQAPAGSGKTELLTQRLLKLLSQVNEPEQILAITFTRAATAEMRTRVINALQQAQHTPESSGEPPSLRLARGALANARRRGWDLVEQPQRLNIQTIDSLCLTIAHQTPLLSGLGAALNPTEQAEAMYMQAARRTLQRLGGEDAELSTAISSLLRLRDTSLTDCERLIAGMLANRDQWGRVLPLIRDLNWDDVRARLEEPLQREHDRVIAEARQLYDSDAEIASELMQLAQYGANNLRSEGSDSLIALLHELPSIAHFATKDHWLCLCELLLTKDHEFRRAPNKHQGFGVGAPGKPFKERFKSLINRLEAEPAFLDVLCQIRKLPPTRYDEEQWLLVRDILLLLRYAIAELRLIFAERGVVDFVELGLTARQVLRNEDTDEPSEEAVRLAERWLHLLVDEFQDTSRAQYELLTLFVSAWESAGAGRCFLVGDPMQSIYLFRQAEVDLFQRTRQHGLGNGTAALRLTPLQLRTNFRSRPELVRDLNTMFAEVFSSGSSAGRTGARAAGCDYRVGFEPSEPTARARAKVPGFYVWPEFLDTGSTPEQRKTADEKETQQVLDIIQQAWPQVESARASGTEFRIAVLVRVKRHAAAIAKRLREVEIPFRAVEIETLAERQEILDLAALARALLHPMDRIAWLSVLRAPWSGVMLADLHLLCGADERAARDQPLLELLRTRTSLLSADGQRRATRVAGVLEEALRRGHSQPAFSAWVERVWHTLGGRACVDDAGYENARLFFAMLDAMSPSGAACLGSELDEQLARLFAQPDPRASERCGVQLMTIHKSKGLGFDVVIVPGLHRQPAQDSQSLFCWLERTTADGGSEFLLAPIGAKGDDKEPLYRWVSRQRTLKTDEESKRLLYVACTRAKEELHLLGTATVRETAGAAKIEPGEKKSLLATGWPALQRHFTRAWAARHGQAVLPFWTATGGVLDLAAAAESGHPATIKLRRLRSDWQPAEAGPPLPTSKQMLAADSDTGELFSRPEEGTLKARAFGTVVHALLEKLARRGDSGEPLFADPESDPDRWKATATNLLRNAGRSRTDAVKEAAEVVHLLRSVTEDEIGRWILAAHPRAQTETSWSGWFEGALRTVRADRIFVAGGEPASFGDTHLWIVDYKTTRYRADDSTDDGAEGLDQFDRTEKQRYEAQLAAYARIMRLAYGDLGIRLGLYYPALRRLVWWTP